MLTLNLFGPLCLRDAEGVDRTPRGRKAQGLLALVATSPRLRRSRGWLQARLWSDRGEQQASASLRQCLCEVRTVLGPHVACLVTEGGWVAFDPQLVGINDRRAPSAPSAEFLEGLDVRDQEFEDWLRTERSARDDVRPATPRSGVRPGPPEDPVRPLLLVGPMETERPELRHFASTLAESIAQQVSQAGNADVVVAEASGEVGSAPPPGLRIAVRALERGGTLHLQVRLVDLQRSTLIWSALKELDGDLRDTLQSGPLAHLANHTVAVALDELGLRGERHDEADRAALLGYRALRHIGHLDFGEQTKADALLADAFSATPCGVYAAHRALLRVVQVVERTAPDEAIATQQAVEFVREARALDPHNPIVTAAASRVAVILEGKVQGGLELARRAVEQGPISPLAWNSLAGALTRAGRFADAYEAALQARRLASGLAQSYLWDMICCTTAAAAARFADAIQFGEIARDLNPGFKPPLRYLAALYYYAGRVEEARGQLEALRALEKDFSLARWTERDYPVASMRETPLIAIARSGLI